jgi:hypothetical protein
LPDDLLLMNRTGSIGSRVGPAVTTIFIPQHPFQTLPDAPAHKRQVMQSGHFSSAEPGLNNMREARLSRPEQHPAARGTALCAASLHGLRVEMSVGHFALEPERNAT